MKEGSPRGFSGDEFQILRVLNRTQYEPILLSKLESGTWIVAEDYTGTDIAWGVGAGAYQDFLEEINSHLLKEDMAFSFVGKGSLQGSKRSICTNKMIN